MIQLVDDHKMTCLLGHSYICTFFGDSFRPTIKIADANWFEKCAIFRKDVLIGLNGSLYGPDFGTIRCTVGQGNGAIIYVNWKGCING